LFRQKWSEAGGSLPFLLGVPKNEILGRPIDGRGYLFNLKLVVGCLRPCVARTRHDATTAAAAGSATVAPKVTAATASAR
jgi:hypothetical protein